MNQKINGQQKENTVEKAETTSCRVAMLAGDGFEQSELIRTKELLEQKGASVDVIAPKAGSIRGWDQTDWGQRISVDVTLEEAQEDIYDALVLPGGVINADRLRLEKLAIQMVRDFYDAGKPIAAICHAPWVLIEAGLVNGVTLTSVANLKTDLENAGARWFDEAVINDHGLVTSRTPDDIPAWVEKIWEELAEAPRKRPSRDTLLAAEQKHDQTNSNLWS